MLELLKALDALAGASPLDLVVGTGIYDHPTGPFAGYSSPWSLSVDLYQGRGGDVSSLLLSVRL